MACGDPAKQAHLLAIWTDQVKAIQRYGTDLAVLANRMFPGSGQPSRILCYRMRSSLKEFEEQKKELFALWDWTVESPHGTRRRSRTC